MKKNNTFTATQIIGKTMRLHTAGQSNGITVKKPTNKLAPTVGKADNIQLTPEQQAHIMERRIAEYFSDKPLKGIEDLTNKAGNTWNAYTLSRKACYGKSTEDIRAEKPQVFFENYGDMLQTAIADILDEALLAKACKRVSKKLQELDSQGTPEPKTVLLRAYFNVARNAVQRYLDQNRAKMYRIAVTDEGQAPTKEQAKELRQARSDWYSDRKYVPTIESIDEETQTTVYEYHEPVRHYNQRVATVNQDERYKGNTSLQDAEMLAYDAGELELATALLRIDLKTLLASKPNDLKVAEQLLDGTMDWNACQKLNWSRRERIQTTFKQALGL